MQESFFFFQNIGSQRGNTKKATCCVFINRDGGKMIQKTLGYQNCIFSKTLQITIETFKKPFFLLSPIEMRYTGRKRVKTGGSRECYSFKNIGNQNRDIQKAIFSTFTNREEVYWYKLLKQQKFFLHFYLL